MMAVGVSVIDDMKQTDIWCFKNTTINW